MKNAMLYVTPEGGLGVREGTDAEYLKGMLEWYEFDAKCKAEFFIRSHQPTENTERIIEESKVTISNILSGFRKMFA